MFPPSLLTSSTRMVAETLILFGRLKIEIVRKSATALPPPSKKSEPEAIVPFIAKRGRVVNERGIWMCIGWRQGNSGIRCDPKRRWTLRICCKPT